MLGDVSLLPIALLALEDPPPAAAGLLVFGSRGRAVLALAAAVALHWAHWLHCQLARALWGPVRAAVGGALALVLVGALVLLVRGRGFDANAQLAACAGGGGGGRRE